jgi:hypothetical protein
MLKYCVEWTSVEGRKYEEEFGTHDGAVRFCEQLHRDIGKFKKPPGIKDQIWGATQKAKRKRKK